MLTHLHVKNFAVVKDVEVDFGDNLNILTGETGAGKSVIIGSVNIALGGRISSDMIRSGEDYAYVEMVFEPSENIIKELNAIDIYPEDNMLVISRRIRPGKSISKVNGETVISRYVKRYFRLCLLICMGSMSISLFLILLSILILLTDMPEQSSLRTRLADCILNT